MVLDKKKERFLRKEYTAEGIRFTYEGEKVPSFPLNSNDSETLSKLLPQAKVWLALEDLWGEELIVKTSTNSWTVPYEIYEKLEQVVDVELLNTLELPVPDSLDIELTTKSYVGDPSFRIVVEAFHPESGPLRDGDTVRYGPVFWIGPKAIVPLTTAQRTLYDSASGKDVDWNNLEERMTYLAKVKDASLEVGARLDAYLQSEDYGIAEELELDLREDSHDELTLIPKIKDAEEFEEQINENLISSDPPTVITKVVSPSSRKRLVLDKSLRKKIATLPNKGKITGQDVPRILTNPEQIVPEGFNLSLFSERVKGFKVKVYNSRPYLHVRRSTGGWFEGIPGIDLEDWSPGEETDADSSIPEEFRGKLSLDTYRELLRRAKEAGQEYVQYEDAWIRVDLDMGEKFEQIVEDLQDVGEGIYKIPAGSILDIYENLELLEFVDPKSLTQEDAQLPEDLPEIGIPDDFSGDLYKYQLTGYRWLNRISGYRIGGLLADEMGLGKTVQVIAHILQIKESGENGPHLIVVPKSLMENWQREIHRFTNGRLATYPYEGAHRVFSEEFFSKFDIVLTTYDTLRRDQARLGTISWNMVVCDEAQYVKNPTAQRTSATKALKSKHRAALTGTPVENGLIEFWCIMDFVQPGLLGSWSDFRRDYERPIIEASEQERESKVQQLLGEIKGYYLRRLKAEILLNFPTKSSHLREVSLSDDQLQIYREIAWKGKTGGKGAALGAIQQLLIISAHPWALRGFQGGDGDRETESVCPKLLATLTILSEIKERNEKAIIFTDFKAVQRILQEAIRRNLGLWPDTINGEITRNRQTIIDIFSEKEGFNVLILGHQVGGVGLNITAANNVIHYTRPWNPAKENQATDRVHRIGQDKAVNIYYPIVTDERFVTVEARLDEVIKSKEDLARDVLRPSTEFKIKPEDLLDCLDVSEN